MVAVSRCSGRVPAELTTVRRTSRSASSGKNRRRSPTEGIGAPWHTAPGHFNVDPGCLSFRREGQGYDLGRKHVK